jgi:hypothetical protein
MRRLGLILILASALALGTGFGCYTMVRHPDTGDLTTEHYSDGQSCSDCHAESDASNWTDPYYTSLYGYYPSTWGAYYAHPWWYDSGWGTAPGPDGGTTVISGRNAWDRGPGAPSGYHPASGGTGTAIGAPSSGSASSTPADSSKTEKPKEKPKEDSKRRLWRR